MRFQYLVIGFWLWNSDEDATDVGGYVFVIVETFLNNGEPSSAAFRVRPIGGQAYPSSMRVQCSKSMRQAYPIGTKFRFPVMLVQRDGGGNFLREVGSSSWEVVA